MTAKEGSHRCAFCGQHRAEAATVVCMDRTACAIRLCDGCITTSLAALLALGRDVPAERVDVCCSVCGRHQAGSRPMREGPHARICLYCLLQARDRPDGRSQPRTQPGDDRRPWRDVLGEMSTMMAQGRVAEFAAGLGFPSVDLGNDVRATVGDAVRQLRGRTGLGWRDFASLVRSETGDREPTADQLVAWETGWESPPMDIVLLLACVATAYNRERTLVGAGWYPGWTADGQRSPFLSGPPY